MPKIDRILRQQPQQIAKLVTSALDRRETLKRVNKPAYDGDLSWKKVDSGLERETVAKYQPNQPTLSSLSVSPSKKLNII